MRSSHERWKEFRKLDREQKLDLARALFQRPHEGFAEVGLAAFRAVFPNAPDEMLRTAIHHIYTDGADAALDFIAAAELSLRAPHERWVDYSITYELLYHVYNWHMFQALLPESKPDVIQELEDLRKAVEGGESTNGILETIDHLIAALDGTRIPPDFRT